MKKNIFKQNLILDGAMGSLLIERSGAPIGYALERLNIENPDVVLQIQKEYVESGSDVVYTNTFGANAFNFPDTELSTIIDSAISIAKKSGARYTALDIGPLGKVIGSGGLNFEEAVSVFKQIVMLASDRTDFIVIETMTSLAELRAAILAVKENSTLPLAVSMSFNENLRTFMGTPLECFVTTVQGLGVDAIGANCSLGAVEMYDIAKGLVALSSVPVFIKPNAGMPLMVNGKTTYDIDAKGFCVAMEKINALGVNIVGGCCGTTPEYIAMLSSAVKNKTSNASIRNSANRSINGNIDTSIYNNIDSPTLNNINGANCINTKNSIYNNAKDNNHDNELIVCCATNFVSVDKLKIVGERINPTGKKLVQSAVRNGDFDYLIAEGVKQLSQNAHILDVNVGVSGIDEKFAMNQIVDRLQEVVPLPLQIDSAKPEVLESALRRYHGKAIVNSVNGCLESLSAVLPIVKKYGAAVIGLTLDDSGIPKTAEKRVEIAQRIINACESHKIPKCDIIIDVLTMAEASEKGNSLTTLEALEKVKALGVKTALGVSNVSFGMPNREDINATFLEMAIERGLDLAIVNPAFIGLKGSTQAENFLLAKDGASDAYIAFSSSAQSLPKANVGAISLYDSIVTGQSGLSEKLAKEMLHSVLPLELAEKHIVPALDEVGMLYEKQRLFLPQLIASAEAAKSAFLEVSKKLEASGQQPHDSLRFVICTVKGDIHDIGKNIVKTVVSNYGFNVIDLGRDVDFDTVLEAVKKNYPCVLGLSALMTTTAENMAKTIDLVKSQFDIPILVGGAVLTPDYAKSIGGEYCKDANETVAKLKSIANSGFHTSTII